MSLSDHVRASREELTKLLRAVVLRIFLPLMLSLIGKRYSTSFRCTV